MGTVPCTMSAAATAVDSMPTDADRRDIAATLLGDSDAYARLVARYQPRVAAHMWRFTRDRTVYEELVQDVFVEAYLNLRSYRAAAPLEHWLMKIATRAGYRHWKRQARRRQRRELPLADHDAVSTPSGIEQHDAAEQVHRLLAQLPPRDRLVLTLLYLEGCTMEEAASLAGWSRTMTKVQAHRAREKLRRMLGEGRGVRD